MDMNYSAPIHQDPLLLIHIVDESWAAETLPMEDINVPPSALTGVDDQDLAAAGDQDEEEHKWNDLGLDDFSKLISKQKLPGESKPRNSS